MTGAASRMNWSLQPPRSRLSAKRPTTGAGRTTKPSSRGGDDRRRLANELEPSAAAKPPVGEAADDGGRKANKTFLARRR